VTRSHRAVAVAVVIFVVALVAESASAAAGKPPGTFNGCPAGLRALPRNWQPAARTAALKFLRTSYANWNRERHWRLRLSGAKAGKAFLVRHWLPSGWIRSECGAAVWTRSVGVSFRLPAMEFPNPKGPCNDCGHVTLLLGFTSNGWITWGNY
jgi:hypothetical protein